MLFGVAYTVISANVWSGQRAREVLDNGYHKTVVEVDVRQRCVQKFGSPVGSLCTLITKPGIFSAYLTKEVEEMLMIEKYSTRLKGSTRWFLCPSF